MREMVILVDENDNEIAVEEKLAAHASGKRHRAVSVFVFDHTGHLLLQQRASGKYHSAGLWSNTCCGHPRPGEPVADVARRRLREELGLSCSLRHVGRFAYRADLGGGLWEHEVDHLFIGRTDARPEPNPEEVGGWRTVGVADLFQDMDEHPERYSVWLRPALAELLDRVLGEVA